ncbi:MAG: DUF1592 domain-containing protein [Planctomycetales bacterium]|nr:DUF1592 domain-containing protein [Planctomycetales bacterium]
MAVPDQIRWLLPYSLTMLLAANCLSDERQRDLELKSTILPLLSKHCFECHTGADADAGLALNHFDTSFSFLKGRDVWEKAIQKLRIHEMPPPADSQLGEADRQRLLLWITETIEEFECGLTPMPGRVTLRRLNAREYQNTIRDLLGIMYTPATSFPGDDVGFGFDNIGDVLTLPPILMEKYLIAAEQISRQAIQTPPSAQLFESSTPASKLKVEAGSSSARDDLTLASSGTASLQEQVPWTGNYKLVVTAAGDQAGNEPCMMVVMLDGKAIRKIPVANDRSVPQDFVVPLRLRAGRRNISIAFVNDFYVAESPGVAKQDRNLILFHVGLTSQKEADKPIPLNELTPTHQAIVFERPSGPQDAKEVTRKVLQRLASRAYRRPVSNEDLSRLVELALTVQQDDGSFEESIQIALQAILISPHFLFRVEPPGQHAAFSQFRDLDDFELATRLSYFLWSSMPDDELLALAWNKQLRVEGVLEEQIKRMILHPKANALVQNFTSQWLTLRKLSAFQPDPASFPKWTDRIRQLAERETLTFFAGVMRYDMSVLRLLDADFTYLNEELAAYYGIPGVVGSGFKEVSLKGSARAGLLTQASVLAVTSNPTRTSPVKRGKWILENLLDAPPPPAPAGVPELKEKGQLTGTLRQRLEQHRADPACANCHKLMDPLGFALENFDAVGIYREVDRGQPIDASGELPDGTTVVGANQLRKLLVEQHQDQFVRCFVEKMLTYALGRGLEYYDKCAVDRIIQSLENSDYRFSQLLLAIVQSDPFQKKGEREIEL